MEAYRARISHLETLLAGFGIRSDGNSSSAPLVEAEEIDRAPPTVHVSMQAERDVAVEQATAANLNALELSTTNQELQRQLEVLRQNPFEAENQALRRIWRGFNTKYVTPMNVLWIILAFERTFKNFMKKMQN